MWKIGLFLVTLHSLPVLEYLTMPFAMCLYSFFPLDVENISLICQWKFLLGKTWLHKANDPGIISL